MRRALGDVDRAALWDNHVHMFGDGRSGTGCWINPLYQEKFPERVLVDIYLAAGGAPDNDDAEHVAFERLMMLQRLANPAGKVVVLGFDYAHDEDGERNLARSSFFTPNKMVATRAAAHRDLMRWGASVHPYRADALEALDEAYADKAVCIKWLPNTQLMDPASPKCDAYYRKLADLQLPLVVHSGYEDAAENVGGEQSFGNPLRLRRALESGVRVIVAHCAGLGDVEDLDLRRGDTPGPQMESWDAFRRLLEEPKYEGQLFGDISAITQFNRAKRPLRELLLEPKFHSRLIHGSDYPLPAINELISTGLLVRRDLMDAYDAKQCDRIFHANPLLFDLIVKRRVRAIDDDDKPHYFSDEVFNTRRVFAHLPHA